MTPGLWLVVALGVGITGLARWRAYQWRRSPLAQASAAVSRRGDDPERLTPGDAALVALVVVVFLAWAAAPLVAELVGGPAPAR